MQPFALRFSQAPPDAGHPSFRYDGERQLNVQPDGSRVARQTSIWMATPLSTSTAGSKVHRDDDDHEYVH
ncbi:hypothetical protein AF335_15180 [Streptomyces eurocidicus]|uniref:Putative ATP-grasp target RiPP n=1 Tax=Streptomyces eurocidicus TaxID=66423 RepID=A0A2N8NVT9_STREU|nr:putative ATP-grasp-modified RiPP [Streptomyces eurocidicus]MBB5121356.1 putative ATP-grasp target RiPP [Streptomyces eurocidicus]MBF6055958.1 putative ATP-grasp-modified RiPP [Streptomyces eurocidicus]PNE32869.1 hypothetical protein AF335_15180 [Streptomyces eurocidicus]